MPWASNDKTGQGAQKQCPGRYRGSHVFYLADGDGQSRDDVVFVVLHHRQAAGLAVEDAQTLVHVGDTHISGGLLAGVIVRGQETSDTDFVLLRQSAVVDNLQIEEMFVGMAPDDDGAVAAHLDAMGDGIFQ